MNYKSYLQPPVRNGWRTNLRSPSKTWDTVEYLDSWWHDCCRRIYMREEIRLLEEAREAGKIPKLERGDFVRYRLEHAKMMEEFEKIFVAIQANEPNLFSKTDENEHNKLAKSTLTERRDDGFLMYKTGELQRVDAEAQVLAELCRCESMYLVLEAV